jgi:hypothetical protein
MRFSHSSSISGPRIERRKGADDASLALLDDEIGVDDGGGAPTTGMRSLPRSLAGGARADSCRSDGRFDAVSTQ